MGGVTKITPAGPRACMESPARLRDFPRLKSAGIQYMSGQGEWNLGALPGGSRNTAGPHLAPPLRDIACAITRRHEMGVEVGENVLSRCPELCAWSAISPYGRGRVVERR